VSGRRHDLQLQTVDSSVIHDTLIMEQLEHVQHVEYDTIYHKLMLISVKLAVHYVQDERQQAEHENLAVIQHVQMLHE